MIISDHHGFAFLHNPKCGGTSVRRALLNYASDAESFWGFREWQGARVDRAHLPLDLMSECEPEALQRVLRSFCFSLTRNPYDRCVSAFNEAHKKSKVPLHTLSAEEYRRRLNDWMDEISETCIDGRHIKYRHFVRQVDVMSYRGELIVDLAMPLEGFPDSLDPLRDFDAKMTDRIAKSNKRNVANHPHVALGVDDAGADEPTPDRRGGKYFTLLSPASVRKVNSLYAADFAAFGYERA